MMQFTQKLFLSLGVQPYILGLIWSRKRGASSVHSIGITTFAMSLVGLDVQTGMPRTPMFTYAAQGPQVNAAADKILKEVPLSERKKHFETTGTVLHHPCYATAQLKNYFLVTAAARRSREDEANKLEVSGSKSSQLLRWTTFSGYVLGKWSGLGVEAPVSFSDAAWTGLFNIHTLQWDAIALGYLGLNVAQFAPLARSSTISALALPQPQPLSKRGVRIPGLAAAEGGELLTHSRVFAGIGDGLAATLASRCRWTPIAPLPPLGQGQWLRKVPVKQSQFSNVSVTIGTSAAARFITSFPAAAAATESFYPFSTTEGEAGLFVYRTNEQEVLIGGALTDAGSLVAWFSDFVGRERLAELMEELVRLYSLGSISDLVLGEGSPLVLPFWSGERSTGWRHCSRGTVAGLTHSTSPLHLLFSLLLGVMLRLREIILQLNCVALRRAEAVDSTNTCIDAIVGSGAVLERWWIWRQMLADVTNLPVLVLKEKNGETTLNGLAVHLVGSNLPLQPQQQDYLQENRFLFGFEKDDIEEVNFPIDNHHNLYKERFQEMKNLYSTFTQE